MQAFQDGVELHQNNSWTCTKFDLKKCASKLQPGYDTKVYIGFETSDITKDVSVECKSLISGDDTSNDVKSLLSVNSSNYEKPTQTTDGIFNAGYYAQVNSDVAQVLGNDPATLFAHFVNYGMAEGRVCSPVYNPNEYLEYNSDVKSVFGNDYVAVYNHS